MKTLGISGGSPRQHTELVSALIEQLAKRDVSVSVVSYMGAETEIDRPGKDSHAHREAGASDVLVVASTRWGWTHEATHPKKIALADLLVHLSPVDIVLAPGYDAGTDVQFTLDRARENVRVTNPLGPKPALQLDNPALIADFIERLQKPKAPRP